MKHDLPVLSTAARVPWREVGNSRRMFSSCSLEFELGLQAPDLLEGIRAACALAQAAGLRCLSLRTTGEDSFFLRLADDGGCDLQAFDQAIGTCAGLHLTGWCTQILRPA